MSYWYLWIEWEVGSWRLTKSLSVHCRPQLLSVVRSSRTRCCTKESFVLLGPCSDGSSPVSNDPELFSVFEISLRKAMSAHQVNSILLKHNVSNISWNLSNQGLILIYSIFFLDSLYFYFTNFTKNLITIYNSFLKESLVIHLKCYLI